MASRIIINGRVVYASGVYSQNKTERLRDTSNKFAPAIVEQPTQKIVPKTVEHGVRLVDRINHAEPWVSIETLRRWYNLTDADLRNVCRLGFIEAVQLRSDSSQLWYMVKNTSAVEAYVARAQQQQKVVIRKHAKRV